MSQFETERASSAYVPPLQRTEGQPPPIAAHDGLSYMSFDRGGDAGTAVALQDALFQCSATRQSTGRLAFPCRLRGECPLPCQPGPMPVRIRRGRSGLIPVV